MNALSGLRRISSGPGRFASRIAAFAMAAPMANPAPPPPPPQPLLGSAPISLSAKMGSTKKDEKRVVQILHFFENDLTSNWSCTITAGHYWLIACMPVVRPPSMMVQQRMEL
uniref:(northern house mosquito) hypothetical protein n=1 Tax=Culex pipiens TaxID=7175 RepID=A0A8D8HH29_CULPI